MDDKTVKPPTNDTNAISALGSGTTADEPIEGRNLSDVAYDRIERAIVHLDLRPGSFTTIADIQDLVKLGRTPVLDAIRKLADDTLVTVLTRRGLRVAPVQLERERRLLALRRDMERFAVELATERATSVQRRQMQQIVRILIQEAGTRNIQAFNTLDHRLDILILDAAREPFAERLLRPLHAIFRRTGYIYLKHLDHDGSAYSGSIERHVDLLAAIADGQVSEAIKASDEIVNLAGAMVDALGRDIDPALLDASITPFP